MLYLLEYTCAQQVCCVVCSKRIYSRYPIALLVLGISLALDGVIRFCRCCKADVCADIAQFDYLNFKSIHILYWFRLKDI
jgi:hypothetical protein